MFATVKLYSDLAFMWLGYIIVTVIGLSIFVGMAAEAVKRLYEAWEKSSYQTTRMRCANELSTAASFLHQHPMAYEALYLMASKFRGPMVITHEHEEIFYREFMEHAQRNLGSDHPLLLKRHAFANRSG